METVGATATPAGQTLSEIEKHKGTHQVHGVLTPGQTPEPDIQRNEADIARRNAKSQSANAPQDPPAVESQTRSEDDNGETEEQIEAVNRVMTCGRKDYRKILGVKDTYASQNEESQAVIDAFRELGCLVHIEYNNAENAETAFNRVLEAAAALGVNDDDIRDMKNWDGKSKILNLRLNASGQQESNNSGQQETSNSGQQETSNSGQQETSNSGQQKTSNSGQQKTSNSDDMDVEKTEPELTSWHRGIYAKFQPLLERLLLYPENPDTINIIEDGNATIKQRNKEIGLREDQFVIKYDMYIENFKKAAPYLARLESHPDEEAKRELESINEGLREFNRKHHYPEDWVIRIPKPPSKQTATRTRGGESTKPKSQTNRTPKFLTITERKGYVLDQGIEKEITGYVPAGWGHQLMLRKDGENNLDIYELVRASKFGKKFIKRNEEFLKGKKIRLGTAKSLEGKNIDEVHIGGIAPVRRYPKSEPEGGWERETKTLVYMSLDRRYIFEWYRRSALGQEFGQEIVDEKLNQYREKAGQESPLPPTKKGTRETKRGTREKRKNRAAIASDDEDEGSISVEEDTSGEDDGEVEDSEDYEDDGDLGEDKAELQLLTNALKQLKTRIKKKQEKPRNEGSAGSQKPKSKRSKAK